MHCLDWHLQRLPARLDCPPCARLRVAGQADPLDHPVPPAGITDSATRGVLQKVAEQTGWTIVVENKPGANSILGADIASKAAPDGYTFLTVIAAHAANATLYASKLPFDVVKSFAPVSLVGIAPLLMAASNDLPAKDIKELIAYAKANPGKISFGSSGVGAAAHLTTELFKQTAGVAMVHVTYRGAALQGLQHTRKEPGQYRTMQV